MQKYILNIILFSFAAAFTGCDTSRLNYPEEGDGILDVAFDWGLAPDADPEGMTVIFFPSGGGNIYRFDIAGKDGGPVRLPGGSYDVVAYNSDAYNELFGYTDSFFLMYAYTPGYSASWFSSRVATRSVPDMVWSASSEYVDVKGDCECRAGSPGLILKPEPLCARYRVLAEDIENLANVRTAGATLDGMAWAVTLHDRKLYTEPTSLPFLFSKTGNGELSANFTPFGDSPSPGRGNTLTLFLTLKDNSHLSYEFDVSDQVNKAPDPMDVTIRIGNIKIPDINPADTIGNSGLDVRVDDWQTVRINM